RPRSVAELAATTDTDAGALERLLRYACGRGFVGHDRHGRYRANGVTAVLRRDHPNPWDGRARFGRADWFWQAWRHADAPLRHPHLQGTLFDLPAVVSRARPSLLGDGDLAARCRIEVGSFFDAVPAGHDRYLLLAIVHDWDDEHAERLLRRVAEAMTPDSRAV